MSLRTRTPRPFFAMRLAKGFTAIELMVVVAIIATLAALAGPSFRDWIDAWQVRNATEEITSTIYFARSEAIKRGGRVSVRKNCGTGTAQEWQCGWIVFTDSNSNGIVNAAAPDLDTILQTFPALTGVNINHLRGAGAASFTLDRWGQINGLGAASFSVTPIPKGVASPYASALCISSGGRIRVLKETVACP